MVIIGLLGPAEVGKSTVAAHLEDRCAATRYSLAAPLKNICQRVFGLSHAQCWGTQAEKETDDPRYGFSPRWLMQRLGTEGFRQEFGGDFWVDYLLARILREQPAVAAIEDVRFINEAANIIAAGGQVWRLEPPAGRTTTANAAHASEAEWSRAPYTHRIAPERRDLSLLFELVDAIAPPRMAKETP
jgi:hypothetical protein